jgi:hypothetical protein
LDSSGKRLHYSGKVDAYGVPLPIGLMAPLR